MFIDEGGAIWLSNPWLAGALIVLAVGLVLWCHRWLETGRAPAPRALRIQARRMSRRPSRVGLTPSRPAIVARSSRFTARPVGAASRPRSAA